MHYYQHNIGDYARDTGHLTVLEHGIYRLLLDWYYLNEKPISTDQSMRVGRGNPVETQSVLSEFFYQELDGWHHKRANKEIADYHVKAVKNRQNGIKGGRPKPNNNPVGSQTDAKHNPNQEPRTINQEPRTKNTEIQAPEGVSAQVWQDFKKCRKTLRAAITQSAIDGIKREADKAGWTLESALAECCARGWRGFKADWVDEKQSRGQSKPTESFAERDERQARERVEEFTGKRRRTVIDITPATELLERLQ